MQRAVRDERVRSSRVCVSDCNVVAAPAHSMKSTDLASSPSKSAVKPVPEGTHTITPYLVCAAAADAIEFYKKAFGATEEMRVPSPDGKLLHASLRIGDSRFMLNDEFPEMDALGPRARQGTSVTLHLSVDDADAWFARAVDAGATVKMPLEDAFWGDRYGLLEDPYGHQWSIATHLRDLTPEEVREAAKTACAG
jgi:PhnB protein